MEKRIKVIFLLENRYIWVEKNG